VAGHEPLERPVFERQGQRVADEKLAVRHAFPRNLEHRLARVEPHDLSGEVLRHPPGSAGDVERARPGELGERLL
jgi:hypothetical protein